MTDFKTARLQSTDLVSLQNSDLCGCFYCLHTFDPSEIDICEDNYLACPRCGIDSIVGDTINITKDNLQLMNEYYF